MSLETRDQRAIEVVLERLELAIVSSGYGRWEYDMHTGAMSWDAQMYRIYGVTPETFKVTRENWRDLMHPDDQKIGTNRFEAAMTGQPVGIFESRIIRHDGSIGYIEGTGLMQVDETGKSRFLFGFNRDITARKNAELHRAVVAKAMTMIAERSPLPDVLNTIVQYFESMHASVLCSILILDSSGTKFKFGAGSKLRKFYDASIRDVSIGPDVGSCGAAAALKTRIVVDDIQSDPRWVRFRDQAREAGVAACWSEPIMLGDQVLGTFAIYHRRPQHPTEIDIQLIQACAQLAAVAIRHVQTEEELEQQRTKLLSSVKMAALGEMAGGIAHEINNPLTVIVGKAWLLKNLAEEELRKNQASTSVDFEMFAGELEKIVDVSNRIAKVIKGLQSFSRNAGHDPLELTSVSQVINDALELSRERFRNHGINLRFDLSRADFKVAVRPVQITQVLLNLLNNAFDAASVLPDRWVEISVVPQPAGKISIRVTDSGRGLSETVIEKLMQPFFTTKEVGKGTGLGLSISKGIVEDHGGRLYYDRDAANTSFVVELELRK